jgi:small-conductance mechanosensitive channel
MNLLRFSFLALLDWTALASVPVNEIPGRLQQTATLVRRANSHAQPLGSIVEIERMLPRFQQGARGLLAATGHLLKREVSLGTTRELRNGWAVISRRLAAWQDIVKKRSGSLEEDLEALDAESKIWRSTLEDAANLQLPQDLRAEIGRALESIGKSEQAVLSRRNTILKLQGELSRLGIDLEEMDEHLSDAIGVGRGKLLRIDAPPLWRSAATPVDGDARAAFGFESVDAAAAVSQYYLLNLFEFIGFELLAFAVLAALLFSQRKKSGLYRQDEDESVRGFWFAVSRPFSTAVLITVVGGALWNSEAPEYLLNLSWYAMLVPLCRILPGLTTPGLKPFLWALAALFAADGLLSFLPAASMAARLLSVLLAAATGVGLLVYKYRLRASALEDRWKLAAQFGIRGGAALLAVSIGSEAIGAVALSRYLTFGVLRCIFAAAAIYGCLALFKGFLQTAFRSIRRRKDSAWRMPEDLQLTMLRGLTWLASALFLVLLLRAFQFWDPLLAWTRRIFEYQVSIGALGFTLGSAVTFLAVLLAAVIFSRVLRFIAAGLQNRIDLQRGTSQAISKLAHYAILTAGFLLALGASGIDLNKFTVLAGGLGVGVAFGMQNIVNNFVSGLILLFERPFHVGDKVTVGAASGEVADIGIRASVIRTWDGADVIIPNASLILGDVTNWTLSDDRRRGELRVGVAYGTEPGRIISSLTETALNHPHVLREPTPTVHFIGFGDSSLDFVLRYWTLLEHYLDAGSQLHEAVYRRLTEEGVNIPFPQREIRLKAAGLPETDSAQ